MGEARPLCVTRWLAAVVVVVVIQCIALHCTEHSVRNPKRFTYFSLGNKTIWTYWRGLGGGSFHNKTAMKVQEKLANVSETISNFTFSHSERTTCSTRQTHNGNLMRTWTWWRPSATTHLLKIPKITWHFVGEPIFLKCPTSGASIFRFPFRLCSKKKKVFLLLAVLFRAPTPKKNNRSQRAW